MDIYSKLWGKKTVEIRHSKVLDVVNLIPFRNSVDLLFTVYCLTLT